MPQRTEDELTIHMRPEFELVLCSASATSPENENRIRTLLGEGLDWNQVLACALEQRLLPVLHERFHALGTDCLTPEQWEVLTELARIEGIKSLFFLGEMRRLYDLFEARQIPAIPYKGPILAWLAYHDVASRTFNDLDFVVPQQYIPQAAAALQAAGYDVRFDPQEAQAGGPEPAGGAYAFVRGPNFMRVELHTERTLRYFPGALHFEEMKARLIPVEIAGRTVRTFSVEDTLVMLCVQGAQKFWAQLSWSVDVAKLVTAQPVDWPLAMRIAAEMKSGRLLLLGLYLAHELFGASLPQNILEQAQRDTNVRWLAAAVREQIQGTFDPSTGALHRAAFRIRSRDGIGEGVWHLLRRAISPAENDRPRARWPRALAPVDAFLRIRRRLRENSVGLRPRLKSDLAIYAPTLSEVAEKMLRLAEITPGDVLYDLGCGDGRIVVMAAEQYGIRAVGVDINPRCIADANDNARRHGVQNRVQFLLGDAKQVDVSAATVVTLYLGSDGNLRLASRLRSQLRPGARIVSQQFRIYGWPPERVESHVLPNGVETPLYLWRIKEVAVKDAAEG